ncbi:hypothetical protein, partial [Streptomonospora sediminis]
MTSRQAVLTQLDVSPEDAAPEPAAGSMQPPGISTDQRGPSWFGQGGTPAGISATGAAGAPPA